MAIGRRPEAPQHDMFVAASEIRAGGSPFYRALDRLLRENGFDGFAEEACREFYAGNRGRLVRYRASHGAEGADEHVENHQERTIVEQMADVGPAIQERRWSERTQACVPTIGPPSSKSQAPGIHENRVHGKADEVVERSKLARSLALTPDVEEVVPVRIVIPQFQTVPVGDDDTAVP